LDGPPKESPVDATKEARREGIKETKAPEPSFHVPEG